MAEYEEKFIVINRKHLDEIMRDDPDMMDAFYMFFKTLQQFNPHLPNHKYYVVNQDEPYAQKVWEVISEGEDKKQEDLWNQD